MTDTVAEGTFEVTITPTAGADPTIGSMTLHKTFQGDLEATASGHMLAIRTPTEGSAGYVAMDRVTGTLEGRHGSFALQHSGTMERGTPSLSITVIPDSGTEALAGISGTLEIDVREGQHFYRFRYHLPK